jgi:hypothetical protein
MLSTLRDDLFVAAVGPLVAGVLTVLAARFGARKFRAGTKLAANSFAK